MTLPEPPPGESQQVLQAIWDLTCQAGTWPTFTQLDRRWDSGHVTDVADVLRQLPEGFVNGFDRRIEPQGATQIRLTAAGAAACPNAQEVLSAFLDFIRVASSIEKCWEPPLDSPEESPSLTDEEYIHQARGLPAAGRRLVLTLLFHLLETESSVWMGLNGPDAEGHWRVSFNRRIRAFRNVTNLDAYWAKRYKSWEPGPTPQAITPSQIADADDDSIEQGADVADHLTYSRDNGVTARRSMPSHIDSEAKPVVQPETAPEPGRPADEGALTVPTNKRIFLSHASADKGLADLLRNTLVLGGVVEDNIFYSSSRGTGIPSGEDVGAYLRRSLQDAGLVIELLSRTFLTRPMCLMELGGAWTLGKPTYPIVVPPLMRDEATRHIGNIQMGVLGSNAEIDEIFDELHGRLSQDLGILANVARWNRAVSEFKEQLPSKLVAAQSAGAAAILPPEQNHPIGAETAKDDKVTISNDSVVAKRWGKELLAEATNHDTLEHSITIKATFYEAGGGIVGTSDAVVQQLAPGGTKTFSMSDIPNEYFRYKIAVDLIV